MSIVRKRLAESPVIQVSPEVLISGPISILELPNRCRLCLEEPHPRQLLDMTAIYDQEAELSYYDCYEICTKEDLRQNPIREPRSLCSRCAVELRWAYDFHKKVANANQQLRELFVSARPNEDLAGQEVELKPEPDEADEMALISEEYWLGQIAQEQEQQDSQEEPQAEEQAGGFVSIEEIAPLQRCKVMYNCSYCQKAFKNYSSMLRHKEIHLANRPHFQCDHCSRSYLTKHALKVHVSAKHKQTGVSCDICGKIFGVAKSLEIHRRYHTRDFPFVCDLCDRKFAQRSHLTLHQQVKHTGFRFMCEFPDCEMSFTSSTSLRYHEGKHTEMPFECSDCQQSFPARYKLRLHLEQKHNKLVDLEELEGMRKFYIKRSKLVLAKVQENEVETSAENITDEASSSSKSN